MRILLLVALVSSFLTSAALAARPIPIHHRETGYTGNTYWASVPYTRGYEVTVTRNVTLRGLSIYADFAPSRTCEPRVYDANGTLRTAGAPQSGMGDGSGANVDWWTLPISTELWAGETVTLAIYCTASATTAFYEHRDPPTAQLDVEGYFTNVTNRSFFGDGFPDGTNSWWGDWRIEIEGSGLHDQYDNGSGTTGSMSNSRGASLVPSRPLSITGIDLYVDLDPGETCTPQIFDGRNQLLAEGGRVRGDGGGLHWYRSDVAVVLETGRSYTIAQYCDQVTTYGRWWNEASGSYSITDFATSVRGRSGGGDGVAPTNPNSITPIMQVHEGELEVVNRQPMVGTSSSSSWSSWSWGWRLRPLVPMTVLGLEALMTRDAGTARARVYDTTTGALLASSDTPMPTSAQLEWREAPLPPTLLSPGGDYTVAVWYSGGTTTAPYYGGTGSSAYARLGVAGGIDFCGSTLSVDEMPSTCTYNHRVERLRVDLPEPGMALGLALGTLVLGAAGVRGRSRGR